MNTNLIARIRVLFSRVEALGRHGRTRLELDEEMRHHLELETEFNIARGMSPEDARFAARVAFGGVERVREEAADARGFRLLDAMRRETRYAWRSLRTVPSFTIIASLTIALGIAAATSVFGFANAIFLRPLVVGRGDHIVRVFVQMPDGRDGEFGHAAVQLIARTTKSLDLVGEHYSTAPLYVGMGDSQAEIPGAVVSADYFGVAGVRPRLGRFFTRDEDVVPDRDAVAVIGEGLWQSRFGADPRILERRITVNGRSFAIIGVAPSSFLGVEPDRTVDEIWIPTAMYRVGYRWCDPLAEQPPCPMSHVLARLAPGATLVQVRAELNGMRRSLLELTDARDSLRAIAVESAIGFSPGSRTQYERLAQLLWGIAAILLIIAFANLAGLLLVRGLERRREIALRLAIGASRPQVVRQLVIESVLLGVLGGAAGVLLSLWGTHMLTSFFSVDSEGYRHALDARVDVRVLAFAAATSLVTTVLFGAFPALAATRTDLADSLKAGGRGGDTGTRSRHVLVAAQIMLSVVLLAGAALLARSVGNILSNERFDASHIALMRLRPRLVGYSPEKAQRYLASAVRQLEGVPGVERVALARGVGFVWNPSTTTVVERPGHPDPAGTAAADRPQTIFTTVSPRFFSTLGVRIDAGREFDDRDVSGAPATAIVNTALAKKLWPDGSPLGRMVMISGKPFSVVGIVDNYRIHHASEPDAPMAFAPFWQNDFEPEIDARVAIRVKGDPAALLPVLAAAARAVDAAVPVTEVLPLSTQASATFADVRLAKSVLIGAGGLALMLSAVGLYGVVAFVVARRRREVGIRLAVGARRGQVIALFLGQNLRWALVGIVVGAAGSFAASRLISAWLVGVEASDPLSFAGAIGAVIVVCFVGTLIPSWQAGGVDPTTALRAE